MTFFIFFENSFPKPMTLTTSNPKACFWPKGSHAKLFIMPLFLRVCFCQCVCSAAISVNELAWCPSFCSFFFVLQRNVDFAGVEARRERARRPLWCLRWKPSMKRETEFPVVFSAKPGILVSHVTCTRRAQCKFLLGRDLLKYTVLVRKDFMRCDVRSTRNVLRGERGP